MTQKILFVCLGNICRSPMAEAVLRALAPHANLNLTIDSAGLGRWHVGDPPDRRAIETGRARGYDLSDQRARRVTATDFETFDWIVAMDRSNLAKLEKMRPASGTAVLHMLMDFCQNPHSVDVPDPYYNSRFDQTLDVVEFGVKALVAALRSGQEDAGAA